MLLQLYCFYFKGQLIPKSSSAIQTTDDVSKITAISVLYASEYINGNIVYVNVMCIYIYIFVILIGNGYYLNGPKEITKITNERKKNINEENKTEYNHKSIIKYEDELEMPVEIIIVSLWYWWKEVLFISVLTAILINIFIPSRLARIIIFIRNCLVSLAINFFENISFPHITFLVV